MIEQEYGFNKSTLGLWISDKIKGAIIGIILGAPILALILWFSQELPNTWWIWGFAAVALFQVFNDNSVPAADTPDIQTRFRICPRAN